jgi:5,10-methylene-tetrahydrofolate dehydrogenase/methenyl tetrahydrofolate cyclohydrolase
MEKVPHLAAVIVGNDGASLTYVGSKVKACQESVLNLLWLNYKYYL